MRTDRKVVEERSKEGMFHLGKVNRKIDDHRASKEKAELEGSEALPLTQNE